MGEERTKKLAYEGETIPLRGLELAELLEKHGVRFVYGFYKKEEKNKPLLIMNVKGNHEDDDGYLLSSVGNKEWLDGKGAAFLGIKGAGRMANGNYLHVIDIDDNSAIQRIWMDNHELFKGTICTRGSKGFHIYVQTEKPMKTEHHDWGELLGIGAFAFMPPSRNRSTKKPYIWFYGDKINFVPSETLAKITKYVRQKPLAEYFG